MSMSTHSSISWIYATMQLKMLRIIIVFRNFQKSISGRTGAVSESREPDGPPPPLVGLSSSPPAPPVRGGKGLHRVGGTQYYPGAVLSQNRAYGSVHGSSCKSYSTDFRIYLINILPQVFNEVAVRIGFVHSICFRCGPYTHIVYDFIGRIQ